MDFGRKDNHQYLLQEETIQHHSQTSFLMPFGCVPFRVKLMIIVCTMHYFFLCS